MLKLVWEFNLLHISKTAASNLEIIVSEIAEGKYKEKLSVFVRKLQVANYELK